jgi:sigma-B regulation protein RsbU (phosphoserine phosphatase)
MNPQPCSTVDTERISRVIFEYAAKIGRERNPDELLALISELARDLVAADRCSIWIRDTEASDMWTKVAHGEDEIRIPTGKGLVGSCVADGEPVLVNDTKSDPRFLGWVDDRTGYVTTSALVVPLRSSDGNVMGAFQALNKDGGFAAQDVDLLRLAASYSASALEEQRLRGEAEQARLFMKEIEIAREVQQQLFPSVLPDPPGFEYASFCRAAKSVGGDYYDYFWLPDGNVGLTLGDVAGKGISAAIMMASIQASLRSLLLRAGHSLAEILGEYNKTVYESTPVARYSTLFCACIDVSDRRVSYINCGQESPLVLRGSGGGNAEIERLSTGGLPIGLVPSVTYEQASLVLEPGDVLVSYSDGISEVANPAGELWDEHRVEELAWMNRRSSAQQLIDILLEAADDYAAGADQYDDMTVSVLRSL